jgi:hypothetical protein
LWDLERLLSGAAFLLALLVLADSNHGRRPPSSPWDKVILKAPGIRF